MAPTEHWQYRTSSIAWMSSRLISTRQLWVAALWMLTTSANAMSSYYVSAAGSDLHDGLSVSTPWKSLAKINTVKFSPGDVLHFRSGDTFAGQITIAASAVSLRSYGTGPKPVITGGVLLTAWTVYKGPIYQTKTAGVVKNLYVNGIQMTMARYPNTGWLKVASTDGRLTVSAAGLDQAAGYWTGANVRIRTQEYEYETHPVISSAGHALTLGGTSGYGDPYKLQYGFYLDNTLKALDAPNEWYWNSGDSILYFYAPGGVNPARLNVIGSVFDYGVSSRESGITITKLAFTYQAAAAIHFSGTASAVRILSNDIYGQWLNGIDFVGTHSHCTIDGNTIRNANGRGINVPGGPNYFTITHNTISNIGLVPGYGIHGWQCATGILSQNCSRTVIGGNSIDSTGYCGIRCDGSENIVEHNVLTNTMMRLDDGGAIYLWNGDGRSYGSIWRKNIVINCLGGGIDNTPTAKIQSTNALYLDGVDKHGEGVHDMVIEGNTVKNAGTSTFFAQYGSYNNTVRNNVFYNTGNANGISMNQKFSFRHGGTRIARNIFYSKFKGQAIFLFIDLDANAAVWNPAGTIDSNYYFTPMITDAFAMNVRSGWKGKSFTEWRQWTGGQDSHSKIVNTPMADSLYINTAAAPATVTLSPILYRDVDGNDVSGKVTLPPYSSKLLFRAWNDQNDRASTK
jgi:parallel beta-helix repeat protein